MKKMEFKRKIYDELLLWNQNPNKVPLIIDGVRQVGFELPPLKYPSSFE